MRVLLAEDSGVMRKIIARALGSLWIDEVVEAADGVEALELFGDGSGIDLILTDWNMPNMSGLELIQKIREDGHKIPIMMITTESEKQKVVQAIQAGVNDYMVKPFDQEMLQMKLRRLLPQRQQAT
ncbi:MAG: response regulator [Planctomycetota bacterium]